MEYTVVITVRSCIHDGAELLIRLLTSTWRSQSVYFLCRFYFLAFGGSVRTALSSYYSFTLHPFAEDDAFSSSVRYMVLDLSML